MDSFDLAITLVYFGILLTLGFYGFHRYLLIFLNRRHRSRAARCHGRFQEPPPVTVQVPLYNEMYVAERVIDAVCRLDYPSEQLQIQVLDDSTDETVGIARAAVEKWRSRGVDIDYIHRTDRTGFKAGALENGLKTARGEFVAIFDADFVPDPDYLERTIHYFTDPKVGLVQARWEHLNRDFSFLTRAQAVLLDGHFMLESFTRFLTCRFFNFNGTAGILRRQAIEDAGGWQHDTLTEDLDLSYRAQLKGWKFIFLPDLPVPAELPVDMNAFKAQQCRWAKGTTQTARKILPALLGSNLGWEEKLEAWYHLTSNFSYPLMVGLTLVLFPALVVRFNQGLFELLLMDLPLFLVAFASVNCFYIYSQKLLRRDWYRIIVYLPAVLSIGIGMTPAIAKAVIEGAIGIKSPFVRTPKYSVQKGARDWKSKKYRGRMGLLPWIEVALGIYFTFVNLYALNLHIYGVIPFVLMFQFGYFYTGLSSLAQRWRGPATRPRRHREQVVLGRSAERSGAPVWVPAERSE